jgi:hypothetical protein
LNEIDENHLKVNLEIKTDCSNKVLNIINNRFTVNSAKLKVFGKVISSLKTYFMIKSYNN